MRVLAIVACSLAGAAAYTTGSKSKTSLVSDIYVPPEPRTDCKGVGATTDEWCGTSCVMDPPNCPASMCACDGGNPGAMPANEAENNERKRMAEIYENERKNEEARKRAEQEREKEQKEREQEDARRIEEANKAAQERTAPTADVEDSFLNPGASHDDDGHEHDHDHDDGHHEHDHDDGHEHDHDVDDGHEHGDDVDDGASAAVPASALIAGVDAGTCKAIAGTTGIDDDWCITNCGNAPPNCPETMCECGVSASPSPLPKGSAASPRAPTDQQQAASKVLADKEAARQQTEAARKQEQEARLEADKNRIAASDASVDATWSKALPADDAPEPVAAPAAVAAVPAAVPSAEVPGASPAAVAREMTAQQAAASKVFEDAEAARVAREAERVAEQEARMASDKSRVDQGNSNVDAQWATTAKEIEKSKATASPGPSA